MDKYRQAPKMARMVNKIRTLARSSTIKISCCADGQVRNKVAFDYLNLNRPAQESMGGMPL